MENAVSPEVCQEKHKALENYLSNDKAKLARHDTEIKSVQEAIAILTAIQARHDTEIEDHEGRLRGMESKPAKQWDNLITQIITIIIAGVLGGFISRMF